MSKTLLRLNMNVGDFQLIMNKSWINRMKYMNWLDTIILSIFRYMLINMRIDVCINYFSVYLILHYK